MSNTPFYFPGAQPASQAQYHQQPQQQQQAQYPSTQSNHGMSAGMPAPVPGQRTIAPMAALPPEVLAALQGIAPEQLGAIFQAFQSGLIPIPPAAINVEQPAPPTTTPSTINPAQPPLQHNNEPSAPKVTGNGATHLDQEEGGVDDDETNEREDVQARGFLRAPPKGPREPNSRRGSYQYHQQNPHNGRPTAFPYATSSTNNGASTSKGKAPSTPAGHPQISAKLNSKEAVCRAFVLEMHKAGYAYDDLRRSVNNDSMLQRIYHDLGLPIPSGSNSAAPAPSRPVAPVKALPAKVTKPPGPKDRSEYLAKLQAAKAKKSEAPKASATPPTATQAAQSAVQAPGPDKTAASPQVQVAVAEPVAPTPPVVKTGVMTKDKTEEVRRRLEAIKAKRAAEQKAKLANDAALDASLAKPVAVESTKPSPAPTPTASDMGAGLGDAVARMPAQRVIPPLPATPITAISGVQDPVSQPPPLVSKSSFSLPGLFSSFGPSTSQTGSAVLPVIADASIPTGGAIPQSQTIGNRNGAAADERCVIEVSSDEDDNMDIDDSSEDEDSNQPPLPMPASRTAMPQAPGQSSSSSAPDTPNAYKRKLEEIEAFKQQIAEKEKRRKLLNLAPGPISTTPSGAISSTELPRAAGTLSGLGDSSDGRSSPADQSSVRLARAQEKEALQRRLKELEALRAKHNSGSPMTPQVTTPLMSSSGAQPDLQPAQHTITRAPEPYDPVEVDDEIDDADDEDLYGADSAGEPDQSPQHQDAQKLGEPILVDSQAATVSALGQSRSALDHRPQPSHETLPTATEPDPAAAGADLTTDQLNDELDQDDDDLDNIYESTAQQQETGQSSAVVSASAEIKNDADSDDAMDTSEESSGDSSDDEDDDDGEDEGRAQEPESHPSGADARSNEAEHAQEDFCAQPETESASDELSASSAQLAPELQRPPSEVAAIISHQQEAPTTRYTPYESALRRFKDYRYHPDFTNTVPSGFKSLTFNHKIDPVKTLCPFEIDKGRCEVPQCGYQHFNDMVLHDNDLLRLMGTERTPARNPEEETKWKQGLANLIRELRTTNVGRDAGLIAQRIAEYRRSFVNNPSRIVLLDD